MKSIVEALFTEGISPMDSFRPALEDYRIEWEKLLARDDHFLKQLPPELRDEFERLMDEHFSILPLEMAEVYTRGFKLGARLMCEVFSSDHGLGLVSKSAAAG